MKQKLKLVVVIPVGALSSKNRYEHMVDTIESIQHYATPEHQIVIQDNSAPMHLGDRLAREFPQLDIVRAPVNYGLFGGLYKSLSLALLHIHSSYKFDVLMKMDTDALMTGAGIEDAVLRFFSEHPGVGVMGNRLHEGDGVRYPEKTLRFESSTMGWLIDRQRCATLRLYLQQAEGNGYKVGEHVLGGTAIYHPDFIDKLISRDMLLREELRRTMLQEDHMWGLMAYAVGMKVAHFHIPDNPMAVVWKGLPAAPEDLVKANAKIVHSTRYWKQMNEDQIRAFFKQRRRERREETASEPEPA